MHRGKWLIVGIFGLAVCLAVFAWNHQRLRSRNVLAYYGDEAALLIRLAPEVDLWQLDSPIDDDQGEPLLAELLARNDIPHAQKSALASRPGWTHARQALIEDRSYQWDAPAPPAGHWTHVLRFQRGGKEALLLFDIENGRIRTARAPNAITLNPKIAEGFRQYFSPT